MLKYHLIQLLRHYFQIMKAFFTDCLILEFYMQIIFFYLRAT